MPSRSPSRRVPAVAARPATGRRTRWTAAGAVGTVVAAGVVAAVPANAATAASGNGRANSTVTLLRLTVAGHTVRALTASLGATTLHDPSQARITVVPVRVDGTAIGTQHITQDTSNQPGVRARTGSVPGVLSLTSPSVVLRAARTATGPLAQLTGTGIGSISLLGTKLPSLSGAVGFGSRVGSATSKASKTVVVRRLTLPSIGALLAKLGLDIHQLPVDVLRQLVDKLDIATGAVTTAATALDNALAAAGSTINGIDLSTVSSTASAISDQKSAVGDAVTAVDDALAAAPFANPVIVTLLGTLGISAPTTAAQWDALSNADQSALVSALDGLVAGVGTAIATADTALAAARQLLATLKDLKSLLADLVNEIDSVLGDTPLLSVGSLTVGTVASAGGAHRARVIGSLSGLHVLGTDVLKSALGSSSLDLTGTAGTALSTVQNTVNQLTGTLASTLSSVAGLTVHRPVLRVLSQHTSTAPIGSFEAARTFVTGLSLSWPGITLPKALALPGAASLPGVGQSPVDATSLVTQPIKVGVADLGDTATFAAASAPAQTPPGSTPGTSTPNTPNNGSTTPTTGAPGGLAIAALVLLGAGVALRRRFVWSARGGNDWL